MKFSAFILFACFLTQSMSHASTKVRSLKSPQGTKILSVEKSAKEAPSRGSQKLISIPYILSEGPGSTLNILFEEYLYDDAALPPSVTLFINSQKKPVRIPGSEVKILVNQGLKENRINLTILGDGYTLQEKEKFFEDAQRTSQNLFTGSTFASYLPLFNVYAVFVPSQTSGIGDGSPKNTAFRLYRNPKGSKRAIMPGNSGAAEEALRLAPATDYPIIIANDEFYGGLGGRFAISTSSERSGMIVLRHELGHNFGEVGEEYDGGYVYSGANSSGSQITWTQWADSGIKFNEGLRLAGDYVWKNLSEGPFKQKISFPENAYFAAEISSTGWATPNDVLLTIDDKKIELKGGFNIDRNFYSLGPVSGLSKGSHTVMYSENIKDGDNVLAFSNLYAYPLNYEFAPHVIGAYATYDDSNRKVGYRPTHKSCLMRDMTVPYFCSVDKENMWLKFFDRIGLIDGVNVSPAGRGEKNVALLSPKLNGLGIFWYQLSGGKETELVQYRNQASWKASAEMIGQYKVKVIFKTPEVRKYNKNFAAEKSFQLL